MKIAVQAIRGFVQYDTIPEYSFYELLGSGEIVPLNWFAPTVRAGIFPVSWYGRA